jgi:hypothetical protein
MDCDYSKSRVEIDRRGPVIAYYFDELRYNVMSYTTSIRYKFHLLLLSY